MFAAILLDTYNRVFEREMKKDYGTSITDKMETRLGKEVFANALKYGLDDTELAHLREQHRLYQQAAVCYEAGLTAIIQRNYNEALEYLFHAWQLDHRLKNEKVRIESAIKEALLVCCWVGIHTLLTL